MKFLQFNSVVMGYDDEPIRASFDPGKLETRAGSTVDVFGAVMDSYKPETKIVLSPAEIDARNDIRRVLKNAAAGEGLETLRGERYIRLDSEQFQILAKLTREVGPIIIQLWEQTPHLLRILAGALDEKTWDKEQKAAKAEQEEAAKKTAANGASPMPAKAGGS